MAVVGLSLEILYFVMSGGDLRTGIGWDLIFILINLFQIYRLVQDRLSLRLPEKDRELLRRVFTGLDDAQIARLLGAGALCDLPAGTRLAAENEPLERLYFLCAGHVGRELAHKIKLSNTLLAPSALRPRALEVGPLGPPLAADARRPERGAFPSN